VADNRGFTQKKIKFSEKTIKRIFIANFLEKGKLPENITNV
jgi:hypothetical protein